MMPSPQRPLREDEALILLLLALAVIWAVWP